MAKIKKGYYWIKILNIWEPALWNGQEWLILGTSEKMIRGIEKIGSRITPPSE